VLPDSARDSGPTGIVLTLELDEFEHVAVLMEARLLDPNEADDHAAITEATKRFLEISAREKQQ
jgi:hypothetical protein